MSIEDLPLLGICGFSGSGKTTLLQTVIPALKKQGLCIAVIKHDTHGIQLDLPGKDSNILFNSGADTLLQAPKESFFRKHTPIPPDIDLQLAALCRQYDLVLVEGYKDSPIPKVWLLHESKTALPKDKKNIIKILNYDSKRPSFLLALINERLEKQRQKEKVYGCILIGGKSSRMGRAKHLIKTDGKTWLEHTADRLRGHTEKLVIAGSGSIPEQLQDCYHIPDIPDVNGPLAGMLAVMRWAPGASWLVCACDMPYITSAALKWLLDSRKPGTWGILPKLSKSSPPQPLLAYYNFRAALLLEELASGNKPAPHHLCKHPKIISPLIPSELSRSWKNINSEEELSELSNNSQ